MTQFEKLKQKELNMRLMKRKKGMVGDNDAE